MPTAETNSSSCGKVYIVTGGSRGIGKQVVKELCHKKSKDDVVLFTVRSEKAGMEVQQELKDQGLDADYYPGFEITSQDSVAGLAAKLKAEGLGIDVLINNAGFAFKNDATEPFSVQAKETVNINYFGTLNVCQQLFPLLKKGARVVNVSSNCGHLSKINGQEPAAASLREKLSCAELTVTELSQLMDDFILKAGAGTHFEAGWPNSTYKVSKVGVSALSIIQQREMDKARPGEDIVINHVHPGYVSTDMTSGKGQWSVEQGSKSLIFAATLPTNTDVRGAYIYEDCKPTSWVKEEVNLFY